MHEDCLKKIDLLYGSTEEIEALQSLDFGEKLTLYKERVYRLVHQGYNILVSPIFACLF